MQNNREARQSLLHFLEDVEAKLRVRTRLELVSAVARADCDCEGVAARAAHEFLNLFRSRVGGHALLDADIILHARQRAELSLDHNAVCVCVLDNLLGLCDILLEAVARVVNHDRSKAAVDAVLASRKVCAVIQMQHDRNLRMELHRCLDELHKVNRVCVLSRTCRSLQNHWGLELCRSLRDTLHNFHIVDIECTDGVTALISLPEHLSRSDQCHNRYLPFKEDDV